MAWVKWLIHCHLRGLSLRGLSHNPIKASSAARFHASAARVRGALLRMRPVIQGAALGVLLLLIDAFGPEGVPSFIYFRF